MDNIIYEEEVVKEVVFEGDLILDGHMNEMEQRQEVFRMMREAGVEVHNEDEYSIGYEGAEDDNGISETQTSHFVVTRTYKKQVPYKVNYEEVYSGVWILDTSMTPEEQRKKIFEQMHKDGIHLDDEDSLQIGYEGVEDDEGLSETQTTRFVVYRTTKERLSENVEKILANEELDQADRMRMIHDELVALREKVVKATDSSEIQELSGKIAEVSDLLDILVAESNRDYAPFEETLKELEGEIKKIQDRIADNMKEYLESYERIQGLLKEQTEAYDSTVTDQELNEKVENLVQEKMNEDQEAVGVRDIIDQQLQQLKDLVKKRDKVRKDFETAKSLGISAFEYKELTDNFRSRNLVHAIMEKKGLGDLLAIPSKERTADQKRQIRKIRQEIFDELAEAKKNHEDQSILSLVEALYGIETEVQLKGKQRVLIVKPEALNNIKKNSSKFPEKIVNTSDSLPSYQPGEAPKDMVEVYEKKREMENAQREEVCSGELIVGEEDIYDVILRDHGLDIRGDDSYEIGYEGVEDNDGISETQTTKYVVYKVKDKEQEVEDVPEEVVEQTTESQDTNELITIFTNGGKFYVRNPVFDRFDVDPIGEEVRIENTACHEIGANDVVYIDRNKDNDYSPYIVQYREAEVLRVTPEVVEEVPEEAQDTLERVTIFNGDDGKLYARKPVFERFDVEPLSPEEVRIEGTACMEINPVDVIAIARNSNNDYSPYEVDYRDAKIERHRIRPQMDTDTNERITLFEENGRFYVRKPVLDRFDIDPVGPEVRIENTACYEIHPADAIYIDRNAANDYSPYEVDHKEAKVERVEEVKEEQPVVPPVEETKEETMNSTSTPGDGLLERVTVFDGDDGKQYVRKPVFERFDVEPLSPEEVRIEGTACQEIHPEDVRYIEANANNSYSPYEVGHRSVHIPVREINLGGEEDHSADESDEFIEGTNIRKPRVRGVHETDEEYANFLRDYYARVFSQTRDEKQEQTKQPEQPEEYEIVEDKKEDKPLEKFTIFRDIDHPDRMYARGPVFERFDIEPLSENGLFIEGTACYPIPQAAVDYMIQNANNDVSPYVVEYRDIRLELQDEKEKASEEVVANNTGDRGLVDRLVVFRDKNNPNKYYIRKPAFERFDATPIGPEVRLEGVAGYEVSPIEVARIVQNQNNDYSPYIVEYRDVSLDRGLDGPPVVVNPDPVPPTTGGTDVPPTKEEEPDPVPPTEGEKEPEEEIITLFRDTNDNGQVYAPDEVLRRFGIEPKEEATVIQGVPCHKISRDTDQIINSIARMNQEPKLVVKYVDVQVKKIVPVQPKPHVEEILDKVTTGLDIRAKDQKRYRASNLHVAKGFRDELRSGNYAYNIVHVVPATLKAGIGFFRKLSGMLMTSDRARDVMKELEKRLEELSDEELEVLFEEYKGSQLKTDMNNQINPLILERLRQFGLAKVTQLNEKIRNNYSKLFVLLGQIRALEKKLARTEKNAGSLEDKRKELMHEASQCVQSILGDRKLANSLLSSGVHGLEEDFKAVETKLSYVGMRFAKTNDFDNELQHKLGDFGKKLNKAIADENDEEIVDNFMGLESCYFKNTDIQRSIAGRRSVGSKYYSPIAEQFDYRDDPFIRDLFTTVAVTSAAISAINAVRVHQIEARNISNADEANAFNQAQIDKVHEGADAIVGKSSKFQSGMEAQAHQDVLTNADVTERASLDLTGWKFNDAYHAADRAGHAAYNQFNLDVTSRINGVTSDYAQGIISQSEALARMSQISSDAQATLREVVDSSLPILRQYAASHPQFNLTAIEESMQYIVAHPSAIADMNQAIVETVDIARGLQGVEYMPLTALGELPSDMASTLVCAASATLLAANVANTMGKAGKKGVYGNEVTDMMEDYLSQTETQEAARQR